MTLVHAQCTHYIILTLPSPFPLRFCKVPNINGCKSSFRPIEYDVPECSMLGPLFFIIYMTDLPNCIEHGHVTRHADDTSVSNCLKSCRDIYENAIPSLINIHAFTE